VRYIEGEEKGRRNYGHDAIELEGFDHLAETQRFGGNGVLARPA